MSIMNIKLAVPAAVGWILVVAIVYSIGANAGMDQSVVIQNDRFQADTRMDTA
jgi:hypothetical protein